MPPDEAHLPCPIILALSPLLLLSFPSIVLIPQCKCRALGNRGWDLSLFSPSQFSAEATRSPTIARVLDHLSANTTPLPTAESSLLTWFRIKGSYFQVKEASSIGFHRAWRRMVSTWQLTWTWPGLTSPRSSFQECRGDTPLPPCLTCNGDVWFQQQAWRALPSAFAHQPPNGFEEPVISSHSSQVSPGVIFK